MPYTYILEWTNFGKKYIGARWSKGCQPKDLWKTYFTSSKYVKEFVKINGNPDVIKIDNVYENQNDAIERESQLLLSVNAINNPAYLNKRIGMVYDFNDPDIRKKQAISRIGVKHTEEAKRKIGIKSHQRKHSEETKQKLRQKALGHKRNLGRVWPPEQRRVLSDAQKKRWADKRMCDRVTSTPVITSTQAQILSV